MADWRPYPPRRPGGSRRPGWAPEAEAIIDEARDRIESVNAAVDASETRIEALEAGGGGGGAPLIPDPDNPGFYIIPAGSTSIIPDPDHSGFFKIGA